MTTEQVPKSPFKTILNFRDVGETVNILSGSSILRPGLFYRSGQPSTASSSDLNTLKDTYHVRTVLDLRSKSEHIELAKVRAPASPPSSAAVPQSTGSTATYDAIPGFDTRAISLTGSAFERTLFWRLRWGSMAKLIYYMTIGQRTTGISVLGSEVMAPRGLLGLGQDTLLSSYTEILEIFTILANPASYPILLHCTQGKDRTGLSVILVLLLCKVPEQAIIADYRASERELVPERESRMKEIKSIGLTEEFASCPAGFVGGIKQFLDDGWGGVEGYLESIGINEDLRNRVRTCLMAQ